MTTGPNKFTDEEQEQINHITGKQKLSRIDWMVYGIREITRVARGQPSGQELSMFCPKCNQLLMRMRFSVVCSNGCGFRLKVEDNQRWTR